MATPVAAQLCPRCGTAFAAPAYACPNCGYSVRFASAESFTPIRIVLYSLAFVVVGFVIVASVMHSLVTSTRAYKQAIAIAQSSQQVQSTLGTGIKVILPLTGFTTKEKGEQFIQFSVRITGSKGSGRLNAVANEINDVWEFSRLSLTLDRTAQRIDLAPAPQRLALPSVPTKKIYLLPADLDAQEALEWAPAYYQAKLGIDVEVLPRASIGKKFEDPQRHQIDSESYLEDVAHRYSELARDPSNIVIAVTSRDMFIRSFGWSYAENYRYNPRLAIVSCARYRPPSLLANWNPEWFSSRLQKMLTKNIAILYFELPMSSDYTSMLSGGVLSGREIDLMSGSIIGAERQWDPFIDEGDLEVSADSLPGKPPIWRLAGSHDALPQTSLRSFTADLTIGLFVYRKSDFVFEGEYPLQLARVYRNEDPRSRAFGIGTNDSLDIFLVGEMGKYIDLVLEDGGQVHFVHKPAVGQRGDTYLAETYHGSPFSRARAVFDGNDWTVERRDGWKFYFPYRPKALPVYVTVLTGFTDPAGHKYEMVRNDAGELLSITTPSGDWLHFMRDSQRRVKEVTDSTGRKVTYDYNAAGCLWRVTEPDGTAEHYSYDDKSDMLTATLSSGGPLVSNVYTPSGSILSQTLSDGSRFEFHYNDRRSRGNTFLPDSITAPNGLITYIQYRLDGYTESLPVSSKLNWTSPR